MRSSLRARVCLVLCVAAALVTVPASSAVAARGGPAPGTYACYAYGFAGIDYTGITVVIESRTTYQEKGYRVLGRYRYKGGPKHTVVFKSGKLRGHKAQWTGGKLRVQIVKGNSTEGTCYRK